MEVRESRMRLVSSSPDFDVSFQLFLYSFASKLKHWCILFQ